MSEANGGELGQGLADPELISELVTSPDNGREAPRQEVSEFVSELRILMEAVNKLAERGRVNLEISAEFTGGPEPTSADNRLGFNYSMQD